MPKETKSLAKGNESEASPTFISAALHAFAAGEQELEGQSRSKVLAMASEWHLRRFLEELEDRYIEDQAFVDNVVALVRAYHEQNPQAIVEEMHDHAREIGERIKAWKRNLHLVAMEYVEIGRQLMALKDKLSAGANGARTGTRYSHGGWVALCQDYVGISYKTADRYIEDAESYRVLKEASVNNPRMRDYLEAVERGDVRAAKALEAAENWESAQRPEIDPSKWASLRSTLEPGTPMVWLREMEEAALAGDELAARNLEKAASGEVRMGAAYAGWKGGEVTKGKTRRDPDPARIIIKAACSVNKYWGKLHDLDIERRRVVTDTWLALMSDETMPEELARESLRILKQRLGE